MSALSTTAIKDGHRGHYPQGPEYHGHQHHPSTHSLEAERADRISRLAGLERVSTLRAPPHTPSSGGTGGASSLSPQTTPTSITGFPPNYPTQHPLTPAYFDNNGQPVAVTKMSTVGTASATESSHVGGGDGGSRTTAGERDEDMLSTHSNYRDYGSVTSTGADRDAMDEDMERQAYDDRMSDDGSASLVGFGEGAGSTVSGPIYHRRPLPAGAQQPFNLERTHSGLSEARRDRDTSMTGTDTPMTPAAIQERRDARMMDGVAAEPAHGGRSVNQDGFVDTTVRGPVPVVSPGARESAESVVQALDHGESRAGASALGSPGTGGEPLGQFYFEGQRPRD